MHAARGGEPARTSRALLRILTWNLFHGRDRPPADELFTLRSRLARITEDDGTYVQVNRPLAREYAATVAAADWSVCLLQEVPPGWAPRLAAASGSCWLRTLTSRNQLRPLTALAARLNPDLIASWEGGSNLILVREPWLPVPGSHRSLLLNPLPARALRERRRMSFVRLRLEDSPAAEVCVANLHLSTARAEAEREVFGAARAALEWAGPAPLVLGGDLNLLSRSSTVFSRLEHDFGLAGATVEGAIDHLLARGLETVARAAPWPRVRRELELPWRGGQRRLRLSDHDPVEASFGLRIT